MKVTEYPRSRFGDSLLVRARDRVSDVSKSFVVLLWKGLEIRRCVLLAVSLQIYGENAALITRLVVRSLTNNSLSIWQINGDNKKSFMNCLTPVERLTSTVGEGVCREEGIRNQNCTVWKTSLFGHTSGRVISHHQVETHSNSHRECLQLPGECKDKANVDIDII